MLCAATAIPTCPASTAERRRGGSINGGSINGGSINGGSVNAGRASGSRAVETPRQQRWFGRRAFVVGSGALVTQGLLGGCDTSSAPKATTPDTPAPYAGPQQTVDLTVRWRHLERRVTGQRLLAAWQFDEGSGYAFDDVSGQDHTLHITGTRWNTTDSGLLGAIHRRGMRGGAVYLDGTRWLEAAPSGGLAPRDGLSISCWVRPDTMPATTAELIRLADVYTLALGTAGDVALTVTDADGRTHVVRTAAAVVQAGRWSFITATVDPAQGQIQLYVDAEPAGRRASTRFALPTATASLSLGRHLTGAFDETALHGAVLSPEAVRQLYVVGLPKVFTQTAESVDAGRAVFSRFKGSDPIPHPVIASTVATFHFAATAVSEEGARPTETPPLASFAPGVFGGAWRAASHRLLYPSPLPGSAGSFEAWHRVVPDRQDPHRLRRKELFTALGTSSALTLYTDNARWCVDVRAADGATYTIVGHRQSWSPQTSEHVAVSWGEQAGGNTGVVLHVNGVPVGSMDAAPADTTYAHQIGLGGTPSAPTFCLLDDVRISDAALPWEDMCPRGHAATEAAGLDLRDSFDRPPAATPMLWRPGSAEARWSHRRKTWERPAAVGDDPDSVRALFQGTTAGLHPSYHPDAAGHASSIEAGVAFPTAVDGWAGLFVQSPGPGDGAFTGTTFMIDPARAELRLALYVAGRVGASKVLPHDFPMAARTTYELTLTSGDDGIVRGFVDGNNVISMRLPAGSPTSGFAGMLTDGTPAFFSRLHFCALTPATASSRAVRMRVLRYGDGAVVGALALVPFRWHKRRGLLPWDYVAKTPEPAGNIAGADTPLPPRPIAAAPWRAEDSANSDLIVVDGRVLYFMRGNPRVDGRVATARVGVLHASVADFDGVHFTDPNRASGTLTAGTLLVGGSVSSNQTPGSAVGLQLNAPSSAYIGDGKLLFFGRESGLLEAGGRSDGRLVYSRFDTRADAWEGAEPKPALWSQAPAGASDGAARMPSLAGLHGSPEVVSLRDPDRDLYQAVLVQQTGQDGRAVMATTLLTHLTSGEIAPIPGLPVQRSLSRASGGAIYGFRVMFDNGIYYLHYNDGVQVPDWPDRFVLAAALDPYAGPWVESSATTAPHSSYFRRGTELEPDNAAIWQGTMVKHRGCYYLYYENYHAVGDVDVQYGNYGDPQAGSRVGFATA